jgi:hypothetical protein
MQPPSKLAAIFSPTRRLPGVEGAPVHGGGPFGGLEWVVPRAECQYRRMDFASLASRQRPAAARIAARRMDPRPGAALHIAWTGPVAHAWSWTGSAPGIATGQAGWIPESLLRAPPAGDGVRIVRQVDGFEGQHWRDGRLQASQWWQALPATDAWHRFVRAAGLGLDAIGMGVPAPVDPGWSDPWGDPARGLPVSPALLERWAWSAGLVVLAFALGWQLFARAEWSVAQSRLDARMDALRSRAAPLLAARERADTARDALQALRDLQQGEDDYRLMAEVIAPLPQDARLAAWTRDGAKLQVSVDSTDADPRHFVAAYEDNARLSSVVATPRDGGMVLVFDLSAAPAAGVAPAGAGR